MFTLPIATVHSFRALRLASIVFLTCLATPFVVAQDQLWIQQFGSSSSDFSNAASPDGSGGVYVGGQTMGSMGGPNAGDIDAWIARFDAAGNSSWIRQLGTTNSDAAEASAPDGSGGVYVGGQTSGVLGASSMGIQDAWLARFDGAGNMLWIRQFGFGTAETDILRTAAPDGSGGVYVGGLTTHASGYDWFARYDGAGNQIWLRTIVGAEMSALADDGAGGVFVIGSTDGSFGGPSAGGVDPWLARYDGAGNQLWLRQFGSAWSDRATAATPDGTGGVFLGGDTLGIFGGLPAGGRDLWITRHDSAGSTLWIRQFGSAADDMANALVQDSWGGVYLAGETFGSLAGPLGGIVDAVLARHDAAGNPLWVLQVGTNATDRAHAAAEDGAGGILATGLTAGALGGPNLGSSDSWLARYDASCPAGTSYCVASTTSIPGCQASIGAVGSPSLGSPGAYTLNSGAVPGSNLGLCLFGTNGPALFTLGTLGGKLCAKSPLFRSAPEPSGGNSGQCNGNYAFSLQGILNAAPGLTSGATIHAQVWARDPANQDGFLLSDAIEFTVCP